MILPFDNDTHRAVKKLAAASLRSARRRNLLLILTIALAAFIMATIGTAILSIATLQARAVSDTYEAVYTRVTPAQCEKLAAQPEVARAGLIYNLGSDENNASGGIVSLSVVDEAALYAGRQQLTLKEGRLPEKADEVGVTSAYLEAFYPHAGLGDEISVPFDGREWTFTISAVLEQPDIDVVSYGFLVSRAFLAAWPDYDPSGYAAYVHFKDADHYEQDALKTLAAEMCERFDLPHVGYSSLYFTPSRSLKTSDVLQAAALALLVAFGGSIVIRSIFRLSVIEKVRSYGQLRTLGATQKQIRRLVRLESRRLALIGIPVGTLAGLVVGTLLAQSTFAGGISLRVCFIVALVVGAITALMVRLSVRQPMRLAARTSPLEAIRFNGWQKTKRRPRRTQRAITPQRLALINLGRDRRCVASTLLSLSFGGLLLLVSASIFGSYAPEQDANLSFPYGHYRIYLDGEDALRTIMADNPLNDTLREELLAIPGVEAVHTLRSCVGGCTFSGGAIVDGGGLCDVICEDALEGKPEMIKQVLLEGRVPQNDREVLIAKVYANNQETGSDVKVGDELSLTLDGKAPVTCTVAGIFGWENAEGERVVGTMNGITKLDSPGIMITEGLADALVPELMNRDYTWVVQAEDHASVTEAIENVLATTSPSLALYTYDDELDRLRVQQDLAFGGMQVLSWLIFLFGIVNLINMTLSNQLARRHEMSMLRVVGLSQRQMRQTLIIEGLVYVFASSALAIMAGLPIAIWVCRFIGEMMMGGRMAYQFPFLQMAVYVFILVLLEFLLIYQSLRSQNKQGLIAQLQQVEG